MLRLLDLYSGMGGLSLGFELTGAFRTLAGLDNSAIALKSYYAAHHAELELFSDPVDLAAFGAADFLDESDGCRPDVVIGGPPCQGFSRAGRRLEDYRQDERNFHVFHFAEIVRDLEPRAFVMENVPGIVSTGQEHENQLIEALRKDYESAGYAVYWRICDTSLYRVPQVRKRFFMVGVRADRKFEFPAAPGERSLFGGGEDPVTVSDALDDLPSPTEEEIQDYPGRPTTWIQRYFRKESEGLRDHLTTNHKPKTVELLEQQEVGEPLYSSWNHSWVKLAPDRPAPAVKENHRAPSVHPFEPRATSPRECARLQTFPDRVRIYGTKTEKLVQVGNAVPPIFGAHLATALADALGADVPRRWDVDTFPYQSDASVSQEVLQETTEESL